jgi:hypothetical protein
MFSQGSGDSCRICPKGLYSNLGGVFFFTNGERDKDPNTANIFKQINVGVTVFTLFLVLPVGGVAKSLRIFDLL